MNTDQLFLAACQKLDECTAIWQARRESHYRIAARLYREAKEARLAMDAPKDNEKAF